MNSQEKHNTAILVFANSSSVDEIRKGIPKSRELFDELNFDILKKVKKTGLPYFLHDERLQIGSDFGTRFTASIQSVFAKGFDNIITVGNDTPHLTVEMLSRSHKNLKEGKTVIGPSTDGGVYLLGIQKNKFDAQQFRAMPWRKQNLFEALAIAFMRRGILHQLPRLSDLDSMQDAQVILNSKHELSVTLTAILLRLVRKSNVIRKTYHFTHKTGHHNPNFNKGSPSLYQ